MAHSPMTRIPRAQASTRSNRIRALVGLSARELAARFAAAGPPTDLAPLEGDPECLALLPDPLRRWATSARFPWIGKSFRSDAPDRLVGHNRLRLLGGTRALEFIGTIGPSMLDGRPALLLNYNFPDTTNPWWQRRIHDELRELEPGLLAGPVTWCRPGHSPWPMCWFAVNAQDREQRAAE